MVGVLVASHGNLAGALLRTAESIAGECPYAWAVELGMDEAPEAFRERLLAAMRRTDKGAPDE